MNIASQLFGKLLAKTYYSVMGNSQAGSITCGVCATKIEGTRFVCLVCDNYAHCGACQSGKKCAGAHRVSHPMQPVVPMRRLLNRGQKVPFIKQFCCPHCGDRGFCESELRKHCTEYHELNTDPVRCPVCLVYDVAMPEKERKCELLQHLAKKHTLYEGVCCSVCNVTIRGNWYTCLECVGFHACRDCHVEKRIRDDHKSYHPAQLVLSEEEFDLRVQKHDGDVTVPAIFCCSLCDEKEFNVRGLIDHCWKYHADRGTASVQCSICSVLRMPNRFLTEPLLAHLKECHEPLTTGGDGGKTSEEEAQECSICLEKATTGIRVLACGHRYHDACVTPWLKNNATCPLCRRDKDKLGPRRSLMGGASGSSGS